MVYLPRFTVKNQPNAGKYATHGIVWVLKKMIIVKLC